MPEKAKKGWTQVAFGDVVRLCRERSADPAEDGFERYVGLEHLDPGDLKLRRWGNTVDGTTFTNVFRAGQVLFGKRRAYQRKVAVADFDGLCSGDIYVLETNDQKVLLTELLPFICQTDRFFEHAVGTSAGSLSPRTNWESLASYEFALPPLDEQRRIAEVIRGGSRVVEALGLQSYSVSTVIKAMIIDFTQSVAKPIRGRLKDVVLRLESGKSPGGFGRPAGDGEWGVLKVSAVGNWAFVEAENKAIPIDEFDEQYEVHPGDILIARANADPDSVGRTCLVDDCRSGLMISDKTWRLVLKPDVALDPIGVLAWTKSPCFRSHVLNYLGGTDAKNISKERFLSGPLPISDVQQFNEFGERVRLLRCAQEIVQRRQESAIAIVKSIANRMLDS